jgi:hypothetical protein
MVPAAVAGQRGSAPLRKWAVGISVGTVTFNGATAHTGSNGEDLVFVPYRPTMFGVGISYGKPSAILALAAQYGEPGIGFRGVPSTTDGDPSQGYLLVAENAFKLASFSASVVTHLARLSGGPALRPSLGVVLERWTAPGTPVRTLLGAQAGFALDMAIGGAFVAAVEGMLGFTPGSPFLPGDLPEGFRPRSTWRRSLAAVLRLRL